MILSTPISWRSSHSAGRKKLAPAKHWRAHASDGASRSVAGRAHRRSAPRRRPRSRTGGTGGRACAAPTGTQPGGLLGQHELDSRMAVEDTAEREVPEHPVREPAELDHPHRHRRRVLAVVGRRLAAVVVQRHVELLAHRPDRLVVGREERRQPGVGRDARAAAPRRTGPRRAPSGSRRRRRRRR